jgi:hypothetical protein
MSAEIITQAESVRLCELERIIQKGKDTFVEVGTALSEIRQSRLYRSSHGTFEEYFQERLGLEKSHVKQLMDSAKVINNLKTSAMAELPSNERQTRPLAKIPAEQQPAAWEKAQEIAKGEGKPVAARHVEAAVLEVMPKQEPKADPEPLVVDGTEDEEKPEQRTRSPKWTPDDADRLWLLAKIDLDKILPTDKSRERVLEAVIKYAENRIQNNK